MEQLVIFQYRYHSYLCSLYSTSFHMIFEVLVYFLVYYLVNCYFMFESWLRLCYLKLASSPLLGSLADTRLPGLWLSTASSFLLYLSLWCRFILSSLVGRTGHRIRHFYGVFGAGLAPVHFFNPSFLASFANCFLAAASNESSEPYCWRFSSRQTMDIYHFLQCLTPWSNENYLNHFLEWSCLFGFFPFWNGPSS